MITGARIRELLDLRWEDVERGYLTFLETKSGKARRLPVSPTMAEILRGLPRFTPWVFPNARTGRPYTTVANSFHRALERAGITTGDVTLHTLRHTALSRMIDEGYDDYTVMAISGHSSTRMLARYTHPTEERKIGALEAFNVGTIWAHDDDPSSEETDDTLEFLGKSGGRQGTRTLQSRFH